ncbi:MAG: hypothetical protein NTZ85_03870 [Bacteroidia bacterium]|nr:hypothetical protein [Bacteroidia bacterium]
MKKFILVCVLAILTFGLRVSGQEDLRFKYQSKIKHYDRLQATGSNMAIWGGVLTAGGAALIIIGANNYSPETDNSLYTTDYDYESLLVLLSGVLCAEIGIPLFAGGLAMNANCKRKGNEYRNKLQNLSLNVICNPKVQGLSLVYKF